jgi:hypothetical protein
MGLIACLAIYNTAEPGEYMGDEASDMPILRNLRAG